MGSPAGSKAVAPAWEQVFHDHRGMMLRAAFRVTGSPADAEDVLQTVFLRLLRRGAFPAENPEAYLRRAATNAALDVLRARHAVGAALAPQAPGDPDPALRGALRRALARLPPRQAEIFTLRHFEDFTNQQIARQLDLSQVHVAVTLHRARRQLQRELAAFQRSTS